MVRFLGFMLVFSFLLCCNNSNPLNIPVENYDMVLLYDKPANIWEEALPLGNGRLGVMVFGGTHTETLQLNEETVWAGEP